MMLSLEHEIVDRVMRSNPKASVHLDFAGGTGRLCMIIRKYVDRQLVIDVSEKMLSVAANNCPGARLINKDFRLIEDEIRNESIDVATAFRFFPNAEQELRSDAVAFLSSKLKPNGLLLCNNHRNFWSFNYALRRMALLTADVGMTNAQMISIANQNHLTLVETFSTGIVPQNDKIAMLPWRMTERVERFLLRALGQRHRLGYNVIYVFQKAAPRNRRH